MTERELAIARLWFDHMEDFPAKNWFSSSTYDEEELKQFISEELDIPVDEIDYPQTYFIEHQEMYVVGQDFIYWTLEQRPVFPLIRLHDRRRKAAFLSLFSGDRPRCLLKRFSEACPP
jgi:hypothetical protein